MSPDLVIYFKMSMATLSLKEFHLFRALLARSKVQRPGEVFLLVHTQGHVTLLIGYFGCLAAWLLNAPLDILFLCPFLRRHLTP